MPHRGKPLFGQLRNAEWLLPRDSSLFSTGTPFPAEAEALAFVTPTLQAHTLLSVCRVDSGPNLPNLTAPRQ